MNVKQWTRFRIPIIFLQSASGNPRTFVTFVGKGIRRVQPHTGVAPRSGSGSLSPEPSQVGSGHARATASRAVTPVPRPPRSGWSRADPPWHSVCRQPEDGSLLPWSYEGCSGVLYVEGLSTVPRICCLTGVGNARLTRVRAAALPGEQSAVMVRNVLEGYTT